MLQTTFEIINNNHESLNRSKSNVWVLEAIKNNPNVIIVCQEVEDWNWRYNNMVSQMETKPLVHPEFISTNDDLTNLNKKNKPIIFCSYLVVAKD